MQGIHKKPCSTGFSLKTQLRRWNTNRSAEMVPHRGVNVFDANVTVSSGF